MYPRSSPDAGEMESFRPKVSLELHETLKGGNAGSWARESAKSWVKRKEDDETEKSERKRKAERVEVNWYMI